MSTDLKTRDNLAVEICILWNGCLEEVEHIPLTDGNHLYYQDNAAAGFAVPVATVLDDASIADFDADGDVDGDDFLIWQSQFGSGSGSGSTRWSPRPSRGSVPTQPRAWPGRYCWPGWPSASTPRRCSSSTPGSRP